MSWFDRWLARKVRRGLNQEKESEERSMRNAQLKEHRIVSNSIVQIDAHTNSLDSFADLNFRMYKAYSGWVMEVRHNDKRTDRQSTTIHIITESEDLGDSIAKIITIESLRS